MDSIQRIGLQTPITVRLTDQDDGAVLVAGRHRLAAVERLGWTMIDCHIMTCADDEARMWEISENLHRADLTTVERAEHVAEWIRLSDRNASQLATHKKRGQQPGGINAAARGLGVDKDEAHRSIKIAGLSDEAKKAARDTGQDNNQTALLAAARKSSPEDQVEAIRTYEPSRAVKANIKADPGIAFGAAAEFADWLRERAAPNELPTIISWLEGTHPRDVIAAMRREAA